MDRKLTKITIKVQSAVAMCSAHHNYGRALPRQLKVLYSPDV
ncbi:unnamed protein product, partial [Rotaria magnacalcarata]